MQQEDRGHRPVLLRQALDALAIRPDGWYIDATFGRGGHANALLERLGAHGRLLAIDQDPEAVRVAKVQLGADRRFEIVQSSFAMLQNLAEQRGIFGRVRGVLFDLGVSSPQLEQPARGFSFASDGPLDMRMNPDAGVPAHEWLASVSESELDAVLRDLGEERYHRRIARAVIRARERSPIRTTRELAELVAKAVPARERHKDPATRTFQAIRIFINHELDDLRAALPQALDVLSTGGRLVVISFHSLEDRIVKRFIRDQERGEADRLPPDFPVRHVDFQPRLRALGKPVRPGAEEIASNPRARSAVMRAAEKTR